jgi:hypothetical protein
MARKGSFYYQQSAYAMTAVLYMGTMLAKRHLDIPRIHHMLTSIQDAEKEFKAFAEAAERHEQADQRHSTSVVPLPPDADRPGEEV